MSFLTSDELCSARDALTGHSIATGLDFDIPAFEEGSTPITATEAVKIAWRTAGAAAAYRVLEALRALPSVTAEVVDEHRGTESIVTCGAVRLSGHVRCSALIADTVHVDGQVTVSGPCMARIVQADSVRVEGTLSARELYAHLVTCESVMAGICDCDTVRARVGAIDTLQARACRFEEELRASTARCSRLIAPRAQIGLLLEVSFAQIGELRRAAGATIEVETGHVGRIEPATA